MTDSFNLNEYTLQTGNINRHKNLSICFPALDCGFSDTM